MSEFSYTILIPHHNIPLLLKRCLESIPRRKDIQVIVVDDCSTESCKCVESFQDNWGEFLLIENKIPKGAGHARNVGLEFIKGEFVIFADCDDFFSIEFSSILDKYKSSDFDLIYFNVDSVYSDNLEKKAARANYVQEFIKEYFITKDLTNLRYYFTEPWCKIIRTRLLTDNNIKFEETIVANDYYFSNNVGYYASKIAVEKTLGYVVTLRPDSLSVSPQSVKKILVRIGVYQRIYDFYKSHNINCQERYLGGQMCVLLRRSPINFIVVFNKMLFKGELGKLSLFFQYFFHRLIEKLKISR